MRIDHLQLNHISNPVGYVLNALHFSWRVQEVSGLTDEYTQIVIATDQNMKNIIWNSGKIIHLGKPYYDADFDIKPEVRYYWTVTVRTDKGEECTSQTAWFEAPKTDEWEAKWISVNVCNRSMPELYKKIYITRTIKKAQLRCCGLGLYEGYVDGVKIGNEYLMPGYYAYDLIQQYDTYDITDMLHTGENVLSFILGNGWYKGRFVFEGGYENLYGSRLKLIAEVIIEYTDHSKETINTDSSWEAKETNIFENSIYDGEIIDRNAATGKLDVKVLEDDTKLCGRHNVPLVISDSLKVKEIIYTPAGETILDFGEAVTGWVETSIQLAGNVRFTLQYGETLQDGNFYNGNLRTAKAEFTYTGPGKMEGIRPHFTYFGFRYVNVLGLDAVTPDMFVARRIMSHVTPNGVLETSNLDVNRLIDNVKRSQKCNFIDIPLDCPQRDERMGWTGDIAVFARTACYQMECSVFLQNYIHILQLEQKKLRGSVPFFVPLPKIVPYEGINPFLITAGACTWGDAATIVPWEIYLHTKDKKMLQEMYPVMHDWVKYIEGRTLLNEKPYLWQNDRQLGDWLALDNGNMNNPIGRTDQGLIASAYFYYSTELCMKAARILELDFDWKYFKKLADNIKKAFMNEYLGESGLRATEQTQTAYALIIAFDLYEKKHEAILKSGMEKALCEYNNHLSTGFVGTSVLCKALSKIGLNNRAYDLLLNEDYPGWLHEVKLGATTTWERWNSLNDDGSISDNGMNSLNHYAYGCIVGWMYEYMCGYTWDENGNIVLKPMPDPRIQFVNSSYSCANGKLEMNWKYYSNEKLSYEIIVPFQENVSLYLPNGKKYELAAGRHFFAD